jgi:3-hydroxyisobutyrate dehydrogenase-like beta-hydroxyacid dehydrogenase
MLRARVPLFLDPDHPAWFDMRMMQKDIRLARALGESLGSATPAAGLADGLLDRARSLGYADRDIAAFGEVLTLQTSSETAPEALPV